MATLLQLRSEVWWEREIVTPELRWLGQQLCAATRRPPNAAGAKGDQYHLYGAHRSQEWIAQSAWCQNRTYTVQAGLSLEQKRHVAGFDFTPGSVAEMIAQSKRLMAAMKARRLDEVREFYGNTNGDRIVDGWDNLHDRAITSDDSHLWHWHLSIDRRYLRSRPLMERILAIALGRDEDVSLTDNQAYALHSTYWRTAGIIANLSTIRVPAYGARAEVVETNHLASTTSVLLKAMAASEARDKVAAASAAALLDLVKSGGGNVDTAAILTRLDQVGAAVAKQQTDTVTSLIKEIERLNKALLAGAQASADVLDG